MADALRLNLGSYGEVSVAVSPTETGVHVKGALQGALFRFPFARTVTLAEAEAFAEALRQAVATARLMGAR